MNQITIHDRHLIDDDSEAIELLLFTVTRAIRHTHNDGSSAEIFCTPRTSEGWLEFIMAIKYSGGGGMTIGCIQRRKGADFESHS